ncbi:hypothetical protein LIX87_02285 [Weissella viridescens]|uniref:hypothetical protein n=1 Tax=Weissella viridescens TaxID=1629 RepID=UPI00092E35E1|nr:hypothetical protein [Weissella viridescens]MBX4172225.1 hypothetical protein [Weissella viridescens]MCB6839848.1 hypothetical protein [Weissella viridescens]MCB6846580.1 hypothetical protein [Weissella viridescens]WJI90706.1 hypothetical protein PWA48_05155 [Weissella viridescens]
MLDKVMQNKTLSISAVLELIMIVLLFRPMQSTLDLKNSVRDNLSFTTKDMFRLSDFVGWLVLALLVISVVAIIVTLFTNYTLMQTVATVTGVLTFLVLMFQGIVMWLGNLFKDTRLISMTGAYWILLILALIVATLLIIKYRSNENA